MNELVDIEMTCIACGEDFVFSAGEQDFFRAKGFKYRPKSCRKCRAKKKERPYRTDFVVSCAECGVRSTVPFIPKKQEPVYCRACFLKRKPK